MWYFDSSEDTAWKKPDEHNCAPWRADSRLAFEESGQPGAGVSHGALPPLRE